MIDFFIPNLLINTIIKTGKKIMAVGLTRRANVNIVAEITLRFV